MGRQFSRRAQFLALAVVIASLGVSEARADPRIALATSGFSWLMERLWERITGEIAQAPVKRADAALKRQGGSRILIGVDSDALREAMLIELRDDTRRVLREERIGFAGLGVHDGSVELRIREGKDWERAWSKIVPLSGAPAVSSAAEIPAMGDGLIRLAPTEQAFTERLRSLRRQSMEVIERRLAGFAVADASVQADGPDRIRVLAPGVKDPEQLSAIFNKRARITFRLVDESVTQAEAVRNPPAGSEVLYVLNSKDPVLLLKQVLMTGDDIADAQPGFDQRTKEPIVSFRFNASGARRFAQITEENVGRPFAIVLDSDVIALPIIREPILHGSGQISGGFTVRDANNIAVLMGSGALPGRLIVTDQQVVEPDVASGQK